MSETDAKRSRKANWCLDEIHLLLQELLVEGGALFSAVTPSFTTKMKKAVAVILNLVHQINDVLSSKSKFGVNSHHQIFQRDDFGHEIHDFF